MSTVEEGRDALDAAHARCDELERAIVKRTEDIADRRAKLAAPIDSGGPMERHRARIRALEVDLANARRARDEARSRRPPVTAAAAMQTLGLLLFLALLFAWTFVSCRHR